MPFDLAQAARTVRRRYSDAIGFRQTLLDLLFAAGCSVREQAVALEHGDAVFVRTSGPAAPVGGPPLVLVAVDLDPPSSLTLLPDRPAAWPVPLASLGGPAVAIGWLAALHALLHSNRQRPWEVVFVRGPALGLAADLHAMLQGLPADAEVVQIVPGLPAGAVPGVASLDLVRLDLVRPRNIWRFPACDHTWSVSASVTGGDALPRLRALLTGLGSGAAWTLHDLHLQPGRTSHLSAVLRTSVPLPQDTAFTVRELEAEQRLLFPVNDALSGLAHLSALPAELVHGLAAPLHAEVMPDGLTVHALVAGSVDIDTLPDRVGPLSLQWDVGELTRRTPAVELDVADVQAVQGPLPAGAERAAVVWRTPSLEADDEAVELAHAIGQLLRAPAAHPA